MGVVRWFGHDNMPVSPLRRSRLWPTYAELVLAVVFVWGAGDLLSTFLALQFAGVLAAGNL